jgi:Leucine-rich repeat (LRR) protein
LDVGYNTFGKEGFEALLKNRTFTSLNMENNNSRKEIDCETFKGIEGNTTLTSLNLSGNSIDEKMAESLLRIPNLTELNVNYNKTGKAGAQALAKSISLRVLNIRKNDIGDEGAEALAKNKNLLWLDVSENNIRGYGIKALLKNSTFSHLNISDNIREMFILPELEEMWQWRVEEAENYPRLEDLLLVSLRELPVELGKLVLAYCKPVPFTFRSVCN